MMRSGLIKNMFEYQKENKFHAQISDGMEDLGATELKEMKAFNIKKGFRGITFSATRETLYRIVYRSRLISRIIAPLKSFKCSDYNELYRNASRIDWEEILSPSLTFAIFANVSNSEINHSHYASLKLKDAIADYFTGRFGERPDIDTKEPDVWLNLHIRHNQATIGFDVSGGSLHKRGYRKSAVAAPMQETLAAAILRISEWNGTSPLYDPMCGSGTVLIDAAMIGRNIAPGLNRSFASEAFDRISPTAWEQARSDARSAIQSDIDLQLFGYDADEEMIFASKSNAKAAGVEKDIQFEKKDIRDLWIDQEYGVLISNFPYGVKMGDYRELNNIYISFHKTFRNKKGWSIYVLTADKKFPDYFKRAEPDRVRKLFNGAIEVRYYQYFGERPPRE